MSILMNDWAFIVVFAILHAIFCVLGWVLVHERMMDRLKEYGIIALAVFVVHIGLFYLRVHYGLLQEYRVILSFIALFIILKIITRLRLSSIITKYFIFLIINIPIELVAFIIQFKILGMEYVGIEDRFGSILFMVICTLILLSIFWVPIRYWVKKYEIILERYLLFGISNIFIVIYIFNTGYSGDHGYNNENHMLLGAFLIFALFVSVFFMVDLFVSARQEVKLRQQYSEFEETIVPLIEELKANQHDFKNHINALSSINNLSGVGSYETAASLDSCLIAEKKLFLDLPKTGIKVLDALLYVKSSLAKENGIDIRIEISEKDLRLPFHDYEYTTVVGNLLDNAIEAVNPPGEIVISLGIEEGKRVIEVRNTGKVPEENIEMIFKRRFSTKEKSSYKRGYGLYNIRKIVNKYNGKIQVYNSEPWVVFRIVFD